MSPTLAPGEEVVMKTLTTDAARAPAEAGVRTCLMYVDGEWVAAAVLASRRA